MANKDIYIYIYKSQGHPPRYININDAILNCESALNLNISVAKYLSTIVVIIMLLQFLENSEMTPN